MTETMVNEKVETKSLDTRIYTILKNLGVPCSLSGYGYLKDSIKLLYNDMSLYRKIGLVKGVYEEVARINGTTRQRVERAIRHAIERAFLYSDIKIIDKIFGTSYSVEKGKATNGEFICNIVEYLKINEEDIL